MPDLLDRELANYERHKKEELLGRAEGKFALIGEDQVLGVCQTKADAVAEGYKLLGNVPRLVKQILTVEVPENFVSNRMRVAHSAVRLKELLETLWRVSPSCCVPSIVRLFTPSARCSR